jgi:hypothetical protein
MWFFVGLFFTVLAVLTAIGYAADKRAEQGDRTVTPGLALLPGDIKYESQDGRVKVYFPIVTSVVLSIVLSLVLRLFG